MAIILGVCGAIAVLIGVIVAVVPSSPIVGVVFAAFFGSLFLGLVHLARIDWSLTVSAEEVRFDRAKGLTVRPRTITVAGADFAGYDVGSPYRGQFAVSLRHADRTRVRRFIKLSTEVASVEDVDQAFARFGIPRIEKA